MISIATVYNVFVRDFRKQKKRITLTLLALGWGTISIMLLLAFGEGLQRQLTINGKGMGDGISVVWGGQTTIPYKGLGKGRRISLHKEDIAYLRERVSGLKHIGGEYHRWGAEIRNGDTVLSGHINGLEPNYEFMRSHYPERGGRMINELDMQQKRRVAFLGHTVKENLFGEADAVGKQILIQGMPFTVVGVEIDKMQMNSYSGMDQDKCSIPATTFEAIFGDPYLDNLVYQPVHVEEMKTVEKQVYEAMGAKYKFDPTDERALSIWDVAESSRQFNNVILGIKLFLGIVGGLTLLIAGVGVANIMYVSIKERTREIGIKMAVGARRSYILAQFLIEALIITFVGGFGGMAISYILTEAFKRVPIQSDVLDFMGRPTVSMEIGIVVVSVLGLMGLVSGFFPALKASSVNPVESLRYE